MNVKRFLLISFVAVLLTTLAACAPAVAPATGGEAVGAQPTEELIMWRFPLMDNQEVEDGAFQTVIERFQEEYPHVNITIETQPWDDRRQKLLSAIGSGVGPDVFYINPDMIPQFADFGAIIPINDFIDDTDLAHFNPGTLIEWEGQLWALPILQNAPLFIWNLDLIESIGLDPNDLPDSPEDFMAWGEVAKDNDLYLTTWSATSATAGLTQMIWMFGGEIFDADGEVILDSPETVEAYQFIKDLYDAGYIPPDSITASGDDQAALFFQQRVLAIRTDANRFYGSQESYVDNFEWAFGPVPEARRRVTNGTVGSYSVSTKAPNPELAVAWVKHLTAPDNSVLINKTVGYLPPLLGAASYYEGEEAVQILLDLTQYVQSDPVFPVASQAYLILAEEQQAVMTGAKTADQAVQAAQQRIIGAKAQME
jgi:multiple sugar transport system substrate-binding protein